MSQDSQTVFQGKLLRPSTLWKPFGSLFCATQNDGVPDPNDGPGFESTRLTGKPPTAIRAGRSSKLLTLRTNQPLLPLHSRPLSYSSESGPPSLRSSKVSVNGGETKRADSSDTVVATPSPSGESNDHLGCRKFELEKEDTKKKNEPPGLSNEVDNVVAVSTPEFQRYERNVKTDKYHYEEFILDALETDYSRGEPENGWKVHIHPEGGLYFDNTSWGIPVLTDVYIYDESSRKGLETCIKNISEYIKKYELQLPSDICLVLEFRQSGRYGYYFVDHTTRCLFWLDEFDAMPFLDSIRVRYTPSLVNISMKVQYWQHNEYFPDIQLCSDDTLSELRDMLIHAIGDSITSSTSTAPYKIETLERMLGLVEKIEAHKSIGIGSATVVYRFLHNFYNQRFLHLYGEQAARLDINQSIHPERSTGRTYFIAILSPILLYGPEVHLRKLKEISTDSLVRLHDWTGLLTELTGEWKEFTLYATVLLNANVAFLAIQSVDDSASPKDRSPMQRASYFSIVISIGAIVLGLLLVRQHNFTLSRTFIANRSLSALGLETLAVMYSLPYALLLWGMVSFLTAFFLMCASSQDIPTIIIISVIGGTLVALLIWISSASFEDRPYWSFWPFRKFEIFRPKMDIITEKGRLKI